MSTFRTIELSDPRFERDGLRQITIKSVHLKGRGDINLFIPQGIEDVQNLPIVILLHGVYGSHWAWAMKAGAHLTAQKLIEAETINPMLIAMPSDGLLGDGSGYIVQTGKDYEKWIVEDVPKAILEATSFASKQSPVFIAGLSMGGFGALRLGAKYGQRLSGISGHSAITRWDEMALFVEEDITTVSIPEKEKNVIDLILEHQNHLPPLRFDCGQEDPLIEGNRTLHQQLLDRGIQHQYEEFNGGHEWPYWEAHLVETLTFFDGILEKS